MHFWIAWVPLVSSQCLHVDWITVLIIIIVVLQSKHVLDLNLQSFSVKANKAYHCVAAVLPSGSYCSRQTGERCELKQKNQVEVFILFKSVASCLFIPKMPHIFCLWKYGRLYPSLTHVMDRWIYTSLFGGKVGKKSPRDEEERMADERRMEGRVRVG